MQAKPLILLITLCCAHLQAAEWADMPYAEGKDVPVIVYKSSVKARGVLVVAGWAPGKKDQVVNLYDKYWSKAPALGWHVIGVAVGEQPDAMQAGPEMIEGALKHLHSKANLDASLPVVITGVSMGGHVALASLARYPDRYVGAIAIPGMVQRASKLEGKRVVMRVGSRDSAGWRSGVKDSADLLTRAGAEVNFEELAGEGHVPNCNALELLKWVVAPKP